MARLADTPPTLCQTSAFTEPVAPQLHLLRRADQGWRDDSPGTPFTDQYSATTPSAWAMQLLGHNLLYDTSFHISHSINQLLAPNQQENNYFLHTASTVPPPGNPDYVSPIATSLIHTGNIL